MNRKGVTGDDNTLTATNEADAPPLDEGRAPLTGNKAIEDAAITLAMELERSFGRTSVDRRYKSFYTADIENPPRTIDVKAVGGSQRGWFLPLEVPQVNESRVLHLHRRQRPSRRLVEVRTQGPRR